MEEVWKVIVKRNGIPLDAAHSSLVKRRGCKAECHSALRGTLQLGEMARL